MIDQSIKKVLVIGSGPIIIGQAANPSEYKVLIVDDVISNVLLLKVLWTNEKFNIVTAGNLSLIHI